MGFLGPVIISYLVAWSSGTDFLHLASFITTDVSSVASQVSAIKPLDSFFHACTGQLEEKPVTSQAQKE